MHIYISCLCYNWLISNRFILGSKIRTLYSTINRQINLRQVNLRGLNSGEIEQKIVPITEET